MKRVPIKGYEGHYDITDDGRVFSLKRVAINLNQFGIICKQPIPEREMKLNKTGRYYMIGLCKQGKYKRFLVHRLVAFHFLPNPNILPVINHKDFNAYNNNVENLEWTTNEDNLKYSHKNNRYPSQDGEKGNNAKLSNKEVLEIRHKYNQHNYKATRLAKEYNISRTSINDIIKRRTWKHLP